MQSNCRMKLKLFKRSVTLTNYTVIKLTYEKNIIYYISIRFNSRSCSRTQKILDTNDF